MKKNLKKALSAVIALAVAVSMIPASFAAKLTLTDVAETASYATAVNTLVALDIINGYEDNSFKPDNLITRAETTKVVVAALNKIDVAEGMKGNTGFTDVEARHEWATGFINAGVSEGFINGMENNTFGPDLNVTYAQIVTMLVRALGYEEYAQYMGGYPNGYLSIANSEGVTKGVSAGANTPVTRAQVAVLVYNALQTPIVANTGMVYSATAGGFVPNIEKMDGTENNNYKTLLTEDFDAYFVEGYVTNTSKSNAALKADEVEFVLAKSEKYDEDDFRTFDDKTYNSVAAAFAANGTLTVKVGDTDAINYNGSYAQAIVRIDSNDDKVFVSFIPSGKNAVVDFAANLIDTDNLTDNGDGTYSLPSDINYLEYFASESAAKSTKYNLQKNGTSLAIKLYVNGVLVVDENAADADVRTAIGKYVINNNVGKIQLVDTYKTDNYYDTIYADYYATAQISNVNTTSGKITLSDTIGTTGTSITLDDENDDLTYHIYYNGEEIKIADLKIDDIISIAYDVTGTLANSNFYEIYVSREVKAASKLTSKNGTDRIITFAGTNYELVANYDAVQADYTIGNEYDLYLDAFGRVFKGEEAETVDKYAIIDKYSYNSSDDAHRAYLYTAEGAAKNYVVDPAKAEVLKDGTSLAKGSSKAEDKEAVRDAVGTAVYTNWSDSNTGSNKRSVENRVVKYKVSSSTGYIIMIDFLTATKETATTSDKFNTRTNAIGGIKLDSSTKVIDAIQYVKHGYDKVADLSTSSLDKFADDKHYGVYAFGKRNSNSIDPLVVVTSGAKTYDENTRFAVVSNAPGQSQDEAGDDIFTVPVFYKGAENDEEQTLIVTDDVSSVVILGDDSHRGLEVGDIIVYSTNSKGYADELYVISNWAGDIADYSTIFTKTVNDTEPTTFVNLHDDLVADSDNWTKAWANYKNEEVTVLYGVIVGRSAKNLSLGQISTTPKTVGSKTLNAWTDQNSGIIDIALTSDTNVYQYDYSQSSKNRLSVINSGSIPFASFNKSYVFDDVISWDSDVVGGTEQNTNRESANFAYVLVADGEALDVFVLSAK